jgi:hypothetical protein
MAGHDLFQPLRHRTAYHRHGLEWSPVLAPRNGTSAPGNNNSKKWRKVTLLLWPAREVHTFS